MILPTSDNQFHSGIDKLSIRDIMNIHDLSNNSPPSPNFNQNQQAFNNNLNNIALQLVPSEHIPQLQCQPAPFNLIDKAAQKIVSEELTPQPKRQPPPSHIESEDSIVLDTIEEYWIKRKAAMKELQRKKQFRKRIFDRIEQKPSENQQVNRRSQQYSEKESSSIYNNNDRSRSRSRSRGLRLVTTSGVIQENKNEKKDSRILSDRNRSSNESSQSHINALIQPEKPTLFSSKQFEKALINGLTINNTNINQEEPIPANIAQTSFQQNQYINRSGQFFRSQPKESQPLQSYLNMPINQIFQKQKDNIINHITNFVKQNHSMSNDALTNKSLCGSKRQIPNSPFTALSHEQEPMEQIKQIRKKVNNLQERVDEHDKQIKSVEGSISELQRSKEGYRRVNNLIKKQDKGVGVFRKQSSEDSLIKQREERINSLKLQNSRLIMESESSNSSVHAKNQQKKSSQTIPMSSFSSNNINSISKAYNSDQIVQPVMSKNGRPKYFILASPEERDQARKINIAYDTEIPTTDTYVRSPFTLNPKFLD